MIGYIDNINSKALSNNYFRQVLETGKHTQVVLMSIPVNEEIGAETHEDTDQVLYLLEGEGKVVLNGEESPYKAGDLVLVHAGTNHNFINTGDKPLKIITMYSPAHHPNGTIHKTRAEAAKAEY